MRLGASGEIQAKAGSMVAYQGTVTFEHAGSGGLGRMLKKAVTGEGTTLMKMAGSGEVFLADQAQDIHLIYLENDFITVNGPNLLAFDADIDWDIKRIRAARARRWPAASTTSSCAAPAGWRSSPTARPSCSTSPRRRRSPTRRRRSPGPPASSTSIKTDFKMKDLIGRSSGESIQMAFAGQGWVLVQPSEGQVAAAATSSSSSSGGLGNLLGN